MQIHLLTLADRSAVYMTPIHGLRICFVPIEDTRLCCIFQISLCSDTYCSTFATVSRGVFRSSFCKVEGVLWIFVVALDWLPCLPDEVSLTFDNNQGRRDTHRAV
jgi:hypothetical protein